MLTNNSCAMLTFEVCIAVTLIKNWWWRSSMNNTDSTQCSTNCYETEYAQNSHCCWFTRIQGISIAVDVWKFGSERWIPNHFIIGHRDMTRKRIVVWAYEYKTRKLESNGTIFICSRTRIACYRATAYQVIEFLVCYYRTECHAFRLVICTSKVIEGISIARRIMITQL